MNIKKKLTACLVNPIKRELCDLQRKYPDLYPQPLRSIKVLRPWDIPLLEHYLNHRTKILGREVEYRDHSWPPKTPKPIYEAYWEEIARYMQPHQVIVEIGPGNGFYTDRFLPDAMKSNLWWTIRKCSATNSCLISTKINRRQQSSILRIVACLPSAMVKWTSSSLWRLFPVFTIESIDSERRSATMARATTAG
jgi:hypothetical protein